MRSYPQECLGFMKDPYFVSKEIFTLDNRKLVAREVIKPAFDLIHVDPSGEIRVVPPGRIERIIGDRQAFRRAGVKYIEWGRLAHQPVLTALREVSQVPVHPVFVVAVKIVHLFSSGLPDLGVRRQVAKERRRASPLGADDDEVRGLPEVSRFDSLGWRVSLFMAHVANAQPKHGFALPSHPRKLTNL